MGIPNKQPPDFSSWNLEPNEANLFWHEETEQLIPSMDTRPQAGRYWWGTAKFYKYPANPDISGIELVAFGKKAVMKIWGFRDDSGKSLSALIGDIWHVVNEQRGEDVDVTAEVVSGRITKTELCLIRADKTVIGRTIVKA